MHPFILLIVKGEAISNKATCCKFYSHTRLTHLIPEHGFLHFHSGIPVVIESSIQQLESPSTPSAR